MPRAVLRWLAVIAASGLACADARAQLGALTHAPATGAQSIATLDAASGSVVGVGTDRADCCRLGVHVVAQDRVGQQLYFAGPGATSTDPWTLYRVRLASGQIAPILAFDANDSVLALAFERPPARLLAIVRRAGEPIRLLGIDPLTGARSELSSPTNCCALRVGVAAVSAGNLLLAGRLLDDPPATTRMIVLPTSGGAPSTVALTAVPVAMAADASGNVFGVVHEGGSALLVGVSGSGSLSPIGAPRADCCVLSSGLATVAGSALFVLGRETSSGATTAVIAFALGTGVAEIGGAVPAAPRVNAIFDATGVSLGSVLFADGFEPGLVPPKRGAPDDAVAAVDGDSTSHGSMDYSARPAASSAASNVDVAQHGGGDARAAAKGTPVATGIPALSTVAVAVLILLFVLAALRVPRRA